MTKEIVMRKKKKEKKKIHNVLALDRNSNMTEF